MFGSVNVSEGWDKLRLRTCAGVRAPDSETDFCVCVFLTTSVKFVEPRPAERSCQITAGITWMLPGSDAVMSHIDNFESIACDVEASANQIAFSQICSKRSCWRKKLRWSAQLRRRMRR